MQWKIDPAHSNIDFSIKHMMISTVRGSFNDVDATLTFDPENPAASSVEATIQIASINTGAEDRNKHLLSADFFDAETFPTMTFKSTRVEMQGDNVAKVYGDLTIRDVTKEVALDVEFLGDGVTPFGNRIAGFEATTKIAREDFGLTWNVALEQGGVLVGKEVKISLDVQFTPVTENVTA
jgi:polyisoprenoid-binding protein YceI